MNVALYARVSTPHQQQERTIASQLQALHQHITQQGWSLLPEHAYLDEGISGSRLDRPALDRLRDAAGRGEFDAVVVVSPDRLARHYAHQWLLVEELAKFQVQLIFLENPFGDSPQGKLLIQMQGMLAEYERTQILERTRRGRLDKARRGVYMPWAYRCYGYRYLPKRYDSPPQVLIEPTQAEVIHEMYRLLVDEQRSCRQIAKHLNATRTPTPSGQNVVWLPGVVRHILRNRIYIGEARYNYRQAVMPRSRKPQSALGQAEKTGRRYRPESEWIWSEAPAIISGELFDQAQLQLQRNAALSRRQYQPTSERYLLRRLVACGECGLCLNGSHQRTTSQHTTYEYLYYACSGANPLTRGRVKPCPSRRVRAERLDAVVWHALTELLQHPDVIPRLHQSWAEAHDQQASSLQAQQEGLRTRQQRLERQSQRLVDAYQHDIISLEELRSRRQTITSELRHIEHERQRLARSQQQQMHWQQIIKHAERFRQLLGANLEALSFEDRQVVVQCLLSRVVVTGEQVDIYYALPFVGLPQSSSKSTRGMEGTPDDFYRLRLAHRDHQRPIEEHQPD
jgi:site-specific DNA recombinase